MHVDGGQKILGCNRDNPVAENCRDEVWHHDHAAMWFRRKLRNGAVDTRPACGDRDDLQPILIGSGFNARFHMQSFRGVRDCERLG